MSFDFLVRYSGGLHEGLYYLRYQTKISCSNWGYDHDITKVSMALASKVFSDMQMPEMTSILFRRSLEGNLIVSGIEIGDGNPGGVNLSVNSLRIAVELAHPNKLQIVGPWIPGHPKYRQHEAEELEANPSASQLVDPQEDSETSLDKEKGKALDVTIVEEELLPLIATQFSPRPPMPWSDSTTPGNKDFILSWLINMMRTADTYSSTSNSTRDLELSCG